MVSAVSAQRGVGCHHESTVSRRVRFRFCEYLTRAISPAFGKGLHAILLACALSGLAQQVFAQTVIQRENAKTAGVTTQWFIPDASYAANQEIEG